MNSIDVDKVLFCYNSFELSDAAFLEMFCYKPHLRGLPAGGLPWGIILLKPHKAHLSAAKHLGADYLLERIFSMYS